MRDFFKTLKILLKKVLKYIFIITLIDFYVMNSWCITWIDFEYFQNVGLLLGLNIQCVNI